MGHGGQVLGGVPRQALVQPGADDQVVLLAHDQVVASRRCLGGFGDADGAARAGLVVGDHGPLVGLGQFVGDEARQDVGAAARWERNDQAHWLGGVVGGRSRLGLGITTGGKRHGSEGERATHHHHD